MRFASLKLASAMSLIGFVLFAVFVKKDDVSGFDDPIIKVVQGWESPGLTRFMRTISTLGSTLDVVVIAILIVVAFALFLRHRKELVLFAVALGGTALINGLLKDVFERDRPLLHRLAEEEGFSFPSGHSMASFTLAVITVYLLWKHVSSRLLRAVLILLAVTWFVVMGISRIYLGVHYPSDVVAGYLLSGFWVSLTIMAYRKWTAGSGSSSYSY
ncbi:phosphatase PAP2 family protein [Cohnella sp. AR92]|uniref:phosphatase PAP2 family protein n=1 Tax=Cohnella sp. AR92 TaxID=648716 RepID=UPI000F8E8429|nr:phosphatase PAP2 family protein [Cohnella sp. AR92]RUS47099.1 phosphatase PAP2 family protein [Cohnella sp. AR92]